MTGEVSHGRVWRPPAADLRVHADGGLSYCAMARRANVQIVKLEDHKPLPTNAVDYSVVMPFTYG